MSKRHDRRKASATCRKSKLKSTTLDQHFEQTLRRVRAEFERSGEIDSGFECVADAESFDVAAHWPDSNAKAAACAALRDSFRCRRVNRYLFASECWVGKTPGLRPADDPDHGECIQVIAVERNGSRKWAFAEITRNGTVATLGPWQVSGDGDIPQSWLLELLEEGHSDRAIEAEPLPARKMSTPDFQDLMDQQPEAGLRSSFELDDEEGRVFIALSADRYPFGVMGRRNDFGDLFVSRIVSFPDPDFSTAVDKIKQSGAELVVGSEAKELLCKMEQAKGVVLPADRSKAIWEVEAWRKDEWAEQILAEIAFCEAMNIEYDFDFDRSKLCGSIAGYRVRRAPNGLVLVASDSDDDIFVAVETTKRDAHVLGWLRGSEGKLPQFYQKNCWVISPESLHDLEELPGRAKLQGTAPFQELSP